MKKKTMLILLSKSGYDSIKEIVKDLVEEWQKDFVVDFLDGSSYDTYHQKRQEILSGKRYDFLFSFNALALDTDKELTDYLLQGDTKYCIWLFDHPLHHHIRLLECDRHCIVFAPDRYHVAYIKKYYPRITRVHFLPHGGSICQETVPYEKRSIPVSFFGSFGNAGKLQSSFSEKDEVIKVLLDELTVQLKNHTEWTIEEAFDYMIRVYQMEEKESDIPNDLAALSAADMYIRAYYREKVIRTIVSAGIPVEVYGTGWEGFQGDGSGSLRVHPPCNYRQVLSIMGDSKISLNVMPWFKAGSHDRVFNAMGAGAVALTDDSRYYRELDPKDGIITYSLDALEQLPEKIRSLLSDDSVAGEIALAGLENCTNHHLWSHRARQMITLAEG